MQRRSLVLVLALAVLGSLVPSVGSARCAPARGYALERVGSGAVRPGGTVIMQLRPVRTGPIVTLPLTRVDVRSRDATRHAAVRALAANLFAFELPDAAGHFTIGAVGATSLFDVDSDAAAVTPVVVSTGPVLASPPLGERTVGSRSRMPTLALATAAPVESVGTIVRWSSGSWFVPNGADAMIGPGRCVPDLTGYAPITSGEAMTARFVNAAGSLSPETSFTAP